MDNDLDLFIKMLIQNGSLKTADQETAISIFSKFSSEELESVLKLIHENPEYLNIFLGIYRLKRKAFETGNEALWNRILQEEVKSLNLIESMEFPMASD